MKKMYSFLKTRIDSLKEYKKILMVFNGEYFQCENRHKENESKQTPKQTPKQMLQKLLIVIAQAKIGNISEKLLSEIVHIVYYLFQ